MKLLEELGTFECRWPLEGEGADTLFCAHAKTFLEPYCEEHKAKSIRDLEIEPRQPFIPRRKAA